MRNWSAGSVFRIVVLALLALGVPSVAAWQFAQQVTHYPWLALGLALLYEVLLAVGSFVVAVGQGLRARWVERTTDWLDVRLRWWFAGYRRRYCQYLLQQHHDVDVKGLSTQGPYALDLEQVFVDLRLDEQVPHQVSTDLLTASSTSREAHPLWHYLRHPTLADHPLVILGPPGSGKTTLAKYVTLALAADKRHLQGYRLPFRFPILLFLRDHAARIQNTPGYSLAEAVYAQLPKDVQPDSAAWFVQQLRRGHCLVVLDGLDEVADATLRQQVVTWVEQQLAAYRQNRFVLTSRPRGYRTNPVNGVTVLEVCPLTQEQVERFVQRWYLANERRSREPNDSSVALHAKQGANELLQRLQTTSQLTDLTVNPLLLTMIATVHRYRSSLPGRRSELYAEICEVFLGKRQQAKGIPLDLTPAQKQHVLQPLAYHLMVAQQRDVSLSEATSVLAPALARVGTPVQGEDFLRRMEAESGLLVEREAGVFGFAHLTFQEYLAAVHIKEAHLERRLLVHLDKSWWHETIRLYCSQTDASRVISAYLSGVPPRLTALESAVACRREAKSLDPALRQRLQAQLDQDIEAGDVERRRFAARMCLDERLWRLEQHAQQRVLDTTLLTCAEYQAFLDSLGEAATFYRPASWETAHFPSGEGLHPVGGITPVQVELFCAWLTKRAAGSARYRLPHLGESHAPEDQLMIEQMNGLWCRKLDGWAWTGIAPKINAAEALLALQETGAADLSMLEPHLQHIARGFLDPLLREVDATQLQTRISQQEQVYFQLLMQALAFDLARVSALAFDRAREHVLDFARASASAFDRAREHVLASALPLHLNNAFFVGDSASIPSTRADAKEHDYAINLTFSLANALASALPRTIDVTSAVFSDFTASPSALARIHIRIRARTYALTSSHASALIHANSYAISRTRTRARTINPSEVGLSTFTSQTQQGVRCHLLMALADLKLSFRNQSFPWWRHLQRKPGLYFSKEERQQFVDRVLNLYLDLLVQDLQRQGKLPALGGILLVREGLGRASGG